MDIDLAALIAAFGARYLIDSGLDGIEAALELDLDLDQVYGIEPNHKKALGLALKLAANHKATIIHARLEKGLKEALAEMRADRPAIFRLNEADPVTALTELRDLRRDIVIGGDLAGHLAATHRIEGNLALPRAVKKS